MLILNIKSKTPKIGTICHCNKHAAEITIELYGGTHMRKRNIHLCKECRAKLIDEILPF